MADQSKPKSCSSQTRAGGAEAEAGRGARLRLGKRVAAAKVRVAHDYIDTLNAARRRKHPDRQERLIFELRAEIAELKLALFRVRHPTHVDCAIQRTLIAPSDTPAARRPDGAGVGSVPVAPVQRGERGSRSVLQDECLVRGVRRFRRLEQLQHFAFGLHLLGRASHAGVRERTE